MQTEISFTFKVRQTVILVSWSSAKWEGAWTSACVS